MSVKRASLARRAGLLPCKHHLSDLEDPPISDTDVTKYVNDSTILVPA